MDRNRKVHIPNILSNPRPSFKDKSEKMAPGETDLEPHSPNTVTQCRISKHIYYTFVVQPVGTGGVTILFLEHLKKIIKL